jgi:hypothetical protein
MLEFLRTQRRTSIDCMCCKQYIEDVKRLGFDKMDQAAVDRCSACIEKNINKFDNESNRHDITRLST